MINDNNNNTTTTKSNIFNEIITFIQSDDFKASKVPSDLSD